MEKFSSQIEMALAGKRKEEKRLADEIRALENALKHFSKYDIYWPYKVTAKNLSASIQKVRIIRGIEGRFQNAKSNQKIKAKKPESFLISSSLLWKVTSQLPSLTSPKPSPKFRKALDALKNDGLLEYKAEKRRWKLTAQAVKLIIKRSRHGNDET